MLSGMAARWLNIPRLTFLFKAMEAGTEFLDDLNVCMMPYYTSSEIQEWYKESFYPTF